MNKERVQRCSLYMSLLWKIPLVLIMMLGILDSDGIQQAHSLQQLQQAPSYPALKWVYILPKLEWAGFSFVSGDPALGPDGTVYVTWDCPLALDTQGVLKWQMHPEECEDYLWDKVPVVDPQGDVYGEGVSWLISSRLIYGLNAKGLVKWTRDTGFSLRQWYLAFDQDTIYAFTDVLIAISVQDGSLKWRSLPLPDYLQGMDKPFEVFGPAPPVILSDGTILVMAIMIQGTREEGFKHSLLRYIFSQDGSLQSVMRIQIDQPDRMSGEFPLKEFDNGLLRIFSPVIDVDNILYITTTDRYLDEPVYGITLYAIDPEGKILWSLVRRGEGIISEPVLGADGTIYLTLGRWVELGEEKVSTLYAVGPDGEIKWSFQIPDRHEIISGAPAVGADGVIYLPTAISAQWCVPPVKAYGGKIYALSSEGELLWTFETIGDIRSSPTLAKDGTLYFTTVGPCQLDDAGHERDCEGRVYAIQTASPGLADSPWPMLRHDPQHSGRLSSP